MHETGKEIVKAYMDIMGFNQTEMAKRLGISYPTLSRWLNDDGPFNVADADKLIKIIPRLKYTDLFGPEK